MLPTGSAAGSLSNGVSEATAIGNAHTDAKMRGLVGEVGTFTVNNGDTRDWSTNLSHSSIGERGQDPLAALFVCKVGTGGQNYAWAGYEEVTTPPAAEGGSLSGISSGSMGSNEAENPGTDPGNTDPDDDDPVVVPDP